MTDRTHVPFKVGDPIEVIGYLFCPENVGLQGVVDGEMKERLWNDGIVRSCYTVDLENGRGYRSLPEHLRLRPPKSDQSQWIREEVGSWDLCPFNPYKQKESA